MDDRYMYFEHEDFTGFLLPDCNLLVISANCISRRGKPADIKHGIWMALQYMGYLLPMTEETVAYWEQFVEPLDPEVEKRLNEKLLKILAQRFGQTDV